MKPKSLVKLLRSDPTEEDARLFLERVTYRYLTRILNKVIELYNIPKQDAEILHDRFVNMNLIETVIDDEDDEDDDEEPKDQ